MKIQDLEQVRLLSDPLKLKLIQAFAEGPKTARDIAEDTGEKLTKLYRHIDALLDAGLIHITNEEQKRGTVERTFEAVARRFEVDHALFADGETDLAPIRDVIRAGEEELLAALSDVGDDEEPLFVRLRVKGSTAQLAALQESLEQWMADAQAMEDGEETEDMVEAGIMLAFYPIRDPAGP
ncbi:MAG: winged helix-turn-helix transcriptional regulator [Rhodothermales bacterium]|nr:winged helix-turn-helix transcriptional regulator [Rhodothermales bacterium]